MARKKTVRTIQAILEELYEATRIKLGEVLNYNKQLHDVTLPRPKQIDLSVKMFELWMELAPMHQIIRQQNPQSDMFFNSLDHEVEIYKKNAVNDRTIIEENEQTENNNIIEEVEV